MLTIVCRLNLNVTLDLDKYIAAMEESSKVLVKFGKRVRELRKEKKLSQEDLAQKANLHRTYIGMIERAEKNITLLNIQKIANGLEISTKTLFDE